MEINKVYYVGRCDEGFETCFQKLSRKFLKLDFMFKQSYHKFLFDYIKMLNTEHGFDYVKVMFDESMIFSTACARSDFYENIILFTPKILKRPRNLLQLAKNIMMIEHEFMHLVTDREIKGGYLGCVTKGRLPNSNAYQKFDNENGLQEQINLDEAFKFLALLYENDSVEKVIYDLHFALYQKNSHEIRAREREVFALERIYELHKESKVSGLKQLEKIIYDCKEEEQNMMMYVEKVLSSPQFQEFKSKFSSDIKKLSKNLYAYNSTNSISIKDILVNSPFSIPAILNIDELCEQENFNDTFKFCKKDPITYADAIYFLINQPNNKESKRMLVEFFDVCREQEGVAGVNFIKDKIDLHLEKDSVLKNVPEEYYDAEYRAQLGLLLKEGSNRQVMKFKTLKANSPSLHSVSDKNDLESLPECTN